jgi:hypothetical protein
MHAPLHAEATATGSSGVVETNARTMMAANSSAIRRAATQAIRETVE